MAGASNPNNEISQPNFISCSNRNNVLALSQDISEQVVKPLVANGLVMEAENGQYPTKSHVEEVLTNQITGTIDLNNFAQRSGSDHQSCDEQRKAYLGKEVHPATDKAMLALAQQRKKSPAECIQELAKKCQLDYNSIINSVPLNPNESQSAIQNASSLDDLLCSNPEEKEKLQEICNKFSNTVDGILGRMEDLKKSLAMQAKMDLDDECFDSD